MIYSFLFVGIKRWMNFRALSENSNRFVLAPRSQHSAVDLFNSKIFIFGGVKQEFMRDGSMVRSENCYYGDLIAINHFGNYIFF